MYWVKSRDSIPTFKPPAEWTREEDEELLALEKKYYGRWEDVPYKLSHTPYECDVRYFQLKQPGMFNGKIPKTTVAQLGTVAAANSATAIIKKNLAIQEVRLWRTELEKARDHVAFLEEAVRGAEERARNAEIDAEAKDMEQRKTATLEEKQLLLAYINTLQAQVQRSIKDVEWSDKNLDKPSKRLKMSSSSGEGDHLHLLGGSQGSIHPTTDEAQWEGNQATLDDLTATDD